MRFFLPILFLFAALPALAGENSSVSEVGGIKYTAVFGNCPARSAGALTHRLIKVFELTESLYEIKSTITKENLLATYFLSSYKISYNPQKKLLTLIYDCPLPVMRVQILGANSQELYSAILGTNGQLLDPTYEVVLREEEALKRELPYLTMPQSLVNTHVPATIAQLHGELSDTDKDLISEFIVSAAWELSVTMTLDGEGSYASLGDRDWREKLVKLFKTVKYLKKRKRIPKFVNITNVKKVVVKF